MSKIIYDSQNLDVSIWFDKNAGDVKWEFKTSTDFISIYTATQIKTLIEKLQESLDFEWNPT